MTFQRRLSPDDVERVHELRAAGLSAEQIARRLGTVSASTVGRLLRGAQRPEGPATPQREHSRRNERAARATIRALRGAGSLHDEDRALVATVESLAQAVDETPGNAALARVYLMATNQLLQRRGTGIGTVEDLRERMRLAVHRT